MLAYDWVWETNLCAEESMIAINKALTSKENIITMNYKKKAS